MMTTPYQSPEIEEISLGTAYTLFATLSAEAEVDDWGDEGDL